jgi:predicted DCC family thiol-disulfide oxidoreductase YuxK
MKKSNDLTVYFDGQCPLCKKEIAFYRRRKGADGIDWVDVNLADDGEEVVPGLTKSQALAQFHVQEKGGALTSGSAAFAKLWMALPAFNLLGRTFQIKPLSWLLDHAYRRFLWMRPFLQRAASRSEAQPADHSGNCTN